MRPLPSSLPVLTCLLLADCTQPSFQPLCPPLVHYSPEEEQTVARELGTHPDLKELPIFILDYGNERREIRKACG